MDSAKLEDLVGKEDTHFILPQRTFLEMARIQIRNFSKEMDYERLEDLVGEDYVSKVASLAELEWERKLFKLFIYFKKMFYKNYSDHTEEVYRFQVFKKNLEEHTTPNSDDLDGVIAFNCVGFADLDRNEIDEIIKLESEETGTEGYFYYCSISAPELEVILQPFIEYFKDDNTGYDPEAENEKARAKQEDLVVNKEYTYDRVPKEEREPLFFQLFEYFKEFNDMYYSDDDEEEEYRFSVFKHNLENPTPPPSPDLFYGKALNCISLADRTTDELDKMQVGIDYVYCSISVSDFKDMMAEYPPFRACSR